jgi:hypothetical protein
MQLTSIGLLILLRTPDNIRRGFILIHLFPCPSQSQEQLFPHMHVLCKEVVGTLQTRYPYIQLSSQDKLQDVYQHTVTCHTALDLASQLRWAPTLPRVLWLQTSPLDCHVSNGSGPRLSAEVGSGTATCPMALDLASWLRWAPSLPCVLCLRTSPPSWGGLRRCHVSHDSLRATSFKHKEKPNKPACAARHACSQHTRARFHGVSCQGHHALARRESRQCCQYPQDVWTCIYSVATIRLQRDAALWTAPLQCQVTRQHDATLLTECSVAGDKTERAHTVEDIICYS